MGLRDATFEVRTLQSINKFVYINTRGQPCALHEPTPSKPASRRPKIKSYLFTPHHIMISINIKLNKNEQMVESKRQNCPPPPTLFN